MYFFVILVFFKSIKISFIYVMFISEIIIIYYILYFWLLFYRLWYSLILLFTNNSYIFIIILVRNKTIVFEMVLNMFLCFFIIVKIYYGPVNLSNKPHFFCVFKLLIVKLINFCYLSTFYFVYENLLYLAKIT